MIRIGTIAALLLSVLTATGAQAAGALAPSVDPAFDQAKIDTYIDTLYPKSHLPGVAFAIVHGDDLVYTRSFGTADGGKTPVTPDTLFIIGSTTKSFTALAILQLADQNKLRLDDPVTKFLPGFLKDPRGGAITIRMLLNQVSGISHAAGDQPVLKAGEQGPLAIRHWVMGLTGAALNRPVGKTYEYSNANYVVLGAIAEIASGETYAGYLQAHIFAPLGMTDSHAALDASAAQRLARGHKLLFGISYVSDLPYPPSFVPCGFVITSARDLAKYMSAQLPGSAAAANLGISPATLAEWHRGVAAMDPDNKAHYAMGWVTDTFNGVPVVYHSGDTGVFSSEFALQMDGRWGVIALADGSGWLASDYLHEMVSGSLSLLSGRMPRNDSGIHTIVFIIYGVVIGLPVLQLLLLLFAARRGSGWFGYSWPLLIHGAAAASLLHFLPRGIFGTPLTEILTSFPDMGAAALASGAFAAIALALTLFRMATPRAA